ncbi:MAG: bifunctional methylenetetrahydrofolate dehydrogenase/methenyltetrahydrofolate cyclohydrolase [Candidatus Magasanikbacteria bacterium]|nr:bifunctional methylenetetrahydrofolate dehydrogenase/methenyltetrahydrofolate cyclohydrolase [Candidatus Magasanikbacteria bacterium]
MQLIDGLALAKKIRAELKEKISASGLTPGLGVILVGDDPASHLYVRLKEKSCAEAGIYFEKHFFSTDAGEKIVIQKIQQLNAAPNIHGILVQLPLPHHLNPDRVIAAINPDKDVDGFHPKNVQSMREGRLDIEPVLAKAIWRLIDETRKQNNTALTKTLIIGNSDAFTEPLELFLKRKRLNASHIHSRQFNDSSAKQFDIVIVAVGQPNFLAGHDFKDGAIVIDVGINHLPLPTGQVGNGTICGDVNFESTRDKRGWITPVPGGVGPMTVAMLLENVFLLSLRGTE